MQGTAMQCHAMESIYNAMLEQQEHVVIITNLVIIPILEEKAGQEQVVVAQRHTRQTISTPIEIGTAHGNGIQQIWRLLTRLMEQYLVLHTMDAETITLVRTSGNCSHWEVLEVHAAAAAAVVLTE